jgi:membrane protease YdiL (CAAX protease family)
MPIVDELGGGGLDAGVATFAPPAPPAPIEYRPYTGPPKEPKPAVEEAPEPVSPTEAAVPPPGFRIGGTIIAGSDGSDPAPAATPMRLPNSNQVRWRWYHLWLFGSITWWVPEAITSLRGADTNISGLLSRTFALQVVGYLLGLLLVSGFVWSRQKGDWGSVGIARTARSRIDVIRGALFGAAIFLCWLPVGLWLAKGHASLDYRATLVIGNANGIGLVLGALVVIVGAPIIEEIYYRGMLYEKLARKSRFVAVAISTILFTLAHGALFIPAITLLGLSLALRRNKESLWFTIGAHSTWNAIVTVMAVLALTGAALSFTSASGGVHVQYPRDWERRPEHETQIPPGSALTGGIDLALESPNGSIMMVMEMNGLPKIPDKAALRRRLANLPALPVTQGAQLTSAKESELEIRGDPLAVDMTAAITTGNGATGQGRFVAAIPQSSSTMYLFGVICPTVSCDSSIADFETMVTSATFSPTG